MTLGEAIELYIDWSRAKHSPRTVSVYSQHLKKFCEFIKSHKLGDTTFEQISVEDVTTYFRSLVNYGYSDNTIALKMVSIRQMFRYFYLTQRLDWNYEIIPVPKYIAKSYTPVTTDDAAEMLSKITDFTDFKGVRNAVVIAFLHDSGLRNSELCELKITDMDFEKCHAVLISKKNQLRRQVFWSKETNKLIKDYLLMRDLIATSPYFVVGDSPTNRGGMITPRSIQRIIQKYRHRDEIVPHGFRHGLGNRVVRAHIHPRHSQKILGHKNITSHQVYLQVNDEDTIGAYEQLTERQGNVTISAYEKTHSREAKKQQKRRKGRSSKRRKWLELRANRKASRNDQTRSPIDLFATPRTPRW